MLRIKGDKQDADTIGIFSQKLHYMRKARHRDWAFCLATRESEIHEQCIAAIGFRRGGAPVISGQRKFQIRQVPRDLFHTPISMRKATAYQECGHHPTNAAAKVGGYTDHLLALEHSLFTIRLQSVF